MLRSEHVESHGHRDMRVVGRMAATREAPQRDVDARLLGANLSVPTTARTPWGTPTSSDARLTSSPTG